MPKRLAITIAGAVSLGSYEAGVLFEVLNALSEHNTNAKGEDQKIYIDVITGASAGGMTAAIAAQRLLYSPDALSGPENNDFYEAWVERIDLWSLVKMKWKEKIWHSLLSSDLIELIGKEMLIDPIKDRDTKLSKVHPAIEVELDKNGIPIRDSDGNLKPKPLWLGMALTNLDGLNYGYPILQGRSAKFQYTRCVDQVAEEVAVSSTNPVELWTYLRDAAVASGAFPFAFRPQAIARSRTDFDDPTLEDWPEHATHRTFAYTDGGVLQNQPIGLAKNLIEKLIQDRLSKGDLSAYNDADSRLYLFVSPHSLQSGVSVGFTAEKASFPQMTGELVRTYTRQAEFHDWIMAEQLNQQVNSLDQRAKDLADAIKSGGVNPGALKDAAIQLATLLTGSTAARMDEVKRLEIQYADLYRQVQQIGAAAAEAWVNSILTLERAANLQTRDRMNILAVMANGRKELAGTGICSFAGFFSRKFREHDYLVGRIKARQYLATPEVQKILGKIDMQPASLPDPSTLVKVPVPLWQALLIGSPALLWIVVWRVIRVLLSIVGVALILIAVALTLFLKHYLR